MYKKRVEDISRLFVYIYALAQGILGIAWMAANLNVYIPEKLSENYLSAASTLIVDDYMGILYALFLAPFVALFKNITVLHAIVSLVQVTLVFAAAYYVSGELFADTISERGRLTLAVFVTTMPAVLQVCFSFLPNAVLFALILVLTGGLYALINHKSGKAGIVVLTACGGIILVSPDYLAMLLVILIPLLIYSIIKKDTAALFVEGGAVVVLIIMFALGHVICTPESYGRVERTAILYIHQRISWPYILEFKESYKNAGVDNDLGIIKALNIYERFFEDYAIVPMQKLGKSTMADMYKNMVAYMWIMKTSYFRGEIIKDLIFNFFAPFSILFVVAKDIAETLIPMVMSNFLMAAPLISKLLVYGFEMSCIVITVLRIATIRKKETVNWKFGMLILLAMIAGSVYYSVFWFRGFDYRNTLFSTAFPMLLFAGNLLRKRI